MNQTVNRFRQRRAEGLRALVAQQRAIVGRDITILDVGGRPAYWDNVGLAGIAEILVLNSEAGELTKRGSTTGIFRAIVGDARDLSGHGDSSVDIVHSNSVIEHVGGWDDMVCMANELSRVGVRGWVQTPAWEFPIEPHHRLPFLHWFSVPIQRAALRWSRRYPKASLSERRRHAERINLLSRSDMKTLFPGASLMTERFLGWPKSYVAGW